MNTLKELFDEGFYSLPSCFDFYIHTARKIELTQRVYRAAAAGVDIQQTLVRAQLKLFTALLINVR